MSIQYEVTLAFVAELLDLHIVETELADDQRYWVLTPAGEQEGLFGVVAIEPEEGQRSHWTGYLAVADLDDALDHVETSEGVIHLRAGGPVGDGEAASSDEEAAESPRRFAIVTDPQGAVFAPFDLQESEAERPGLVAPGRIGWFELTTPDIDAAAAFYQGLVGWEAGAATEREGEGAVRTLRADGGVFGLVRQPLKGSPFPPTWNFYVRVEDLDACLAKAVDLGGSVYEDPLALDGGRRARVLDPTGASMGLWQAA